MDMYCSRIFKLRKPPIFCLYNKSKSLLPGWVQFLGNCNNSRIWVNAEEAFPITCKNRNYRVKNADTLLVLVFRTSFS